MILVRSSGVDQTREVGAAIAEMVVAGDVLLLSGDLGAGKTAFTQGFARGLGITEQVTSPTFTLCHVMEGGRLTLCHADVYRFEQIGEVEDLGLAEMLDGPAVAVIEWGEAVAPALPADHLDITFRFGDGPDDRTLLVHPRGTRWPARGRALAAALAPWGSADGGDAADDEPQGDDPC